LTFKAVHRREIGGEEVEEGGAKGVQVRWLISKDDGAENFAMRHFEVEPGGNTPYHSHDWEHEVFVLEGKGVVICDGVEKEIGPEYVVFIPSNAQHCLRNTGTGRLRFLCLVPYKR
jgi:quercetin dioxygenase-like cupin family protein